MRLYEVPEHPLRVYLDSNDDLEIRRLISSVNFKYHPPENQYANSADESEEPESLISYDEFSGKYYVVRGLCNIIQRECSDVKIPCTIETSGSQDPLVYPELDANILEGITLREYQLEGISLALAYKRGIIQVHTGGGKTEMMIGVCKYLLDNSDIHVLICVPTTNLLYQTYTRMLDRGLHESDISLLGDGNSVDSSRRVLVSTVQSAYRRLGNDEEYDKWLVDTDCLMMDEAHHSKCKTWSALIDTISPQYLLGFSAEPFHRDKAHVIGDLILRGLLGPVIHRVTIDYLVAHHYLSKPYVVALDSKYNGSMYSIVDWTLVNRSCIVNNGSRNSMIRDVVILLIAENKKPLILVQQIAHGQQLATAISKEGYNVVMMTGGRSTNIYADGRVIDTYKDTENQVITDFNNGKIDALIGTSTLDEGVDIPALSAVLLAGGGKSSIKTLQRIGRGLRPKSGDNTTVIVDFRDRFNVVTNSHFKKRKLLYDELGMPIYYVTSLEDVSAVIHDFVNAN